jgi:hypothetical protein
MDISIIYHVVKFLPPKAIVKCMSICRTWRTAIAANFVCKHSVLYYSGRVPPSTEIMSVFPRRATMLKNNWAYWAGKTPYFHVEGLANYMGIHQSYVCKREIDHYFAAGDVFKQSELTYLYKFLTRNELCFCPNTVYILNQDVIREMVLRNCRLLVRPQLPQFLRSLTLQRVDMLNGCSDNCVQFRHLPLSLEEINIEDMMVDLSDADLLKQLRVVTLTSVRCYTGSDDDDEALVPVPLNLLPLGVEKLVLKMVLVTPFDHTCLPVMLHFEASDALLFPEINWHNLIYSLRSLDVFIWRQSIPAPRTSNNSRFLWSLMKNARNIEIDLQKRMSHIINFQNYILTGDNWATVNEANVYFDARGMECLPYVRRLTVNSADCLNFYALKCPKLEHFEIKPVELLKHPEVAFFVRHHKLPGNHAGFSPVSMLII